jgi:hypothetical protein
VRDFEPRSRTESKKIKLCAASVVVPKFLGGELAQEVAPMTVSSPNVIESKLDRLIDDVRSLRSQMIAFDKRLKEIEVHLLLSKLSEQQPESKSRPWFAAAASAVARTVLTLFAVGAATGAVLHYLGT